MNRKQRRAMKKEYGAKAVEKMQALEETISNMTNSCSVCENYFDKNDKSLLDTWQVKVDKSGFKLTCPSCVD